MRSSLAAWLPWNHLSWVDSSLVVPLEILLNFECFLVTQPSLPAWPLWEPADLSGLEPDGPSLSCLWPPLGCAAFLPNYHENHLIWVDSILIVLLGFHAISSFSSLWVSLEGWSLLIVYCTLFTFCPINDCIFCDIVSLIPLLSNISLLHFWPRKWIPGI